VLTIDDVRAIPLFSTLAVTGLERLAQTSADLHLGAGGFAVPEGGDRALYAVLAGKVKVVKLIDGVERTLSWRVPGQILGEVSIAFGTTFVGGYRASEHSRVNHTALSARVFYVGLDVEYGRSVQHVQPPDVDARAPGPEHLQDRHPDRVRPDG